MLLGDALQLDRVPLHGKTRRAVEFQKQAAFRCERLEVIAQLAHQRRVVRQGDQVDHQLAGALPAPLFAVVRHAALACETAPFDPMERAILAAVQLSSVSDLEFDASLAELRQPFHRTSREGFRLALETGGRTDLRGARVLVVGAGPDAVIHEVRSAAARVDEIVEVSKTSKGAVYFYFPSKQDIFLAIVRATREDARLFLGVSPRGSLALYKGAQAMAAIRGRDYVIPEDIREIALPVLRKRMIIKSEHAARGLDETAVRAVAASGNVPVPGIERLRAAAGAVGALGRSLRGKRLIVHDFFLWKSLSATFPGATGDRVEFSGCQAGTALAYVDWEGNLYPCDSLPIRLGSLEDGTFDEAWSSPARARVADAVRSTPWACEGCAEHRGCLGGCRGMAYLASGSLDSPDPACPEEGRPRR